MSHLTLQQLQVVDALSNGATLTDAAAQAGIHRNTIAKPATMEDMIAATAESDRVPFCHQQPAQPPDDPQERTTAHDDAQPRPVFYTHNSAQPPETYRRPEPKIGRNDPCPCGSGRKYKHCCLAQSAAAGA